MRRKLFALILAAAPLTTGCAHYVGVEYEHISHPFAGPPFGPPNEEDTLDHLNGFAGYKHGRVYFEATLGYRLRDGGFYGPELTGGIRTGVMLKGER